MRKKLFTFSIIIYITFACLIINPASSARAQIPGEGLTISPPILELTVKPGETANQTIRVTNPTKSLIEVYPTVMNFHAASEAGEPAFTPASDEEAKFSLANWIKFKQTKLALTPEQVVDFNYQIIAPEDAEPGGHYGVVFFATQPPESKPDLSQVSISSMLGSLILAKVPGAIVEKGFLEKFSTNKFYFKLPTTFEIKIANLGNVHFKPKGDIQIKGLSGAELARIAVNQAAGNVLPDSTRKFEERWEKKGITIGRFTARLSLVYGEAEKTLDGETVFYVVPLWAIIAAAVLILLVILLIVMIVRRRKKRKKSGFTYHHLERLDDA